MVSRGGTGLRDRLLRSRTALLALLLLVPAAVLLALSVDWFDYQEFQRREVVEVARGEQGELAGAGFELVGLSVLVPEAAPEGIDIPRGTELVVARIRVVPPPAVPEGGSTVCQIDLLQQGAEGERRWDSGASEVGWWPSLDGHSYCSLDEPSPYEFESLYLVPAGGSEGAWLEVSVLLGSPVVLKLL